MRSLSLLKASIVLTLALVSLNGLAQGRLPKESFKQGADGVYHLATPDGAVVVKNMDATKPFSIWDPFVGYPGVAITSPDANFADQKALEAFVNVGRVVKLLEREFRRKSLDGNGGPVEVIMYDDDSAQFQPSHYLLLGRNTYKEDRVATTALIDVIAHELFHGVLNHSSKLSVNNQQSAALNEGMADIFGIYARAKLNPGPIDYTFGRGLMDRDEPMRSLANPAKFDVVDHFSALATGVEADSGHKNSGILTLAFYLFAEGGAHPRRGGERIEGVGLDVAAHVFIETAIEHLKAEAGFSDAREASLEVARKYGTKAVETLSQAWNAVGVVPASK